MGTGAIQNNLLLGTTADQPGTHVHSASLQTCARELPAVAAAAITTHTHTGSAERHGYSNKASMELQTGKFELSSVAELSHLAAEAVSAMQMR